MSRPPSNCQPIPAPGTIPGLDPGTGVWPLVPGFVLLAAFALLAVSAAAALHIAVLCLGLAALALRSLCQRPSSQQQLDHGLSLLCLLLAGLCLLAPESAIAQTSLDSIVSGVTTKGNEAVSAVRKVVVVLINIVFVALGVAALFRKIHWGWGGAAVAGAILVYFSDKFSAWLGSFSGVSIPGLPGL